MTTTSPLICRVRFEAGPNLYAYFCGGLQPKVGDHVVVLVRAGRGNESDGRKMKIVEVIEVTDTLDPRANTSIYGLILPQPTT